MKITGFNDHIDFSNPRSLVPRYLGDGDVQQAHRLFRESGYNPSFGMLGFAKRTCGYHLRGFFCNVAYPSVVWLSRHLRGYNEVLCVGVDRSALLPDKRVIDAIVKLTSVELVRLPTRLFLTSNVEQLFLPLDQRFHLIDRNDESPLSRRPVSVWCAKCLVAPKSSDGSVISDPESTETPPSPPVPSTTIRDGDIGGLAAGRDGSPAGEGTGLPA